MLFLAIALLSIGTEKVFADWTYYDGCSLINPDPDGDPGCYILSCPSDPALCCAIDNNTGFVFVNSMVLDNNGNPTSGNGSLIGNYNASSVVENPNQQTTVEMNVSNLTVCDNCDNIISGWSGK